MIPVYVLCAVCLAAGGWNRCVACDGLGRQWAPGAPAYGCTITLADREPGEIVTLGTGQRAKILWHMPRKARKVKPETTFLGMIAEFTDEESLYPIPYPSCIGVLSVDVARATIEHRAHDGERAEDLNDPLQGRAAGQLI